MRETQVWPLGPEDLLEEGTATHFSVFAWRIPWTEESGGLQPMGLQGVRHERSDSMHACTHYLYMPKNASTTLTELPSEFTPMITPLDLSLNRPTHSCQLKQLICLWRWPQSSWLGPWAINGLSEHTNAWGFSTWWCWALLTLLTSSFIKKDDVKMHVEWGDKDRFRNKYKP